MFEFIINHLCFIAAFIAALYLVRSFYQTFIKSPENHKNANTILKISDAGNRAIMNINLRFSFVTLWGFAATFAYDATDKEKAIALGVAMVVHCILWQLCEAIRTVQRGVALAVVAGDYDKQIEHLKNS